MFHVKHLLAERLEGSRSGGQDGLNGSITREPGLDLVTGGRATVGTMTRSRPIQQVLEPGGNRTIAGDGDQVHPLERSGVPDRQ
jgi:hypothetical protein